MSKTRFVTLALVAAAFLAVQPVETAGPSFTPDGTFTGSALTGWRQLGDATWTAANGEITGTPKSPAGGWLVFDKSFQDTGFFASFRCAAGCKTGVLLRAEKTANGGMKGIYSAFDEADGATYAVVLDASGREVKRDRLVGAGRGGGGGGAAAPAGGAAAPAGRGAGGGRGAGAAAPAPAGPGAAQMQTALAALAAAQAAVQAAIAAQTPPPATGPAGAAAGGGRGAGGGGRGGAAAPANRPDTVVPSGYRAGEWNDLELVLGPTNVQSWVNNSSARSAPVTEEAGTYGPIALYVGGTAPVTFKNVAYKDLGMTTREPEKTGARFKAQQLTDFYYSWGASADDFNKDGVTDILSGPHVFYGPDYTKRREIYVQQAIPVATEYSQAVWMQFSGDFTGDGWPDALNCNFSGVSGCTLYVNPKGEARRWDTVRATDAQSTEIAVVADINADKQLDVVYAGGGTMRWATPNLAKPTEAWTVHVVSEPGLVTAHGVGAGDVNGDGRLDIVNAFGWFEQPAPGGAPDATWKYHPAPFSRSTGARASAGGSAMAVYDVNGDKLADVVTSLAAHGWGLAWFEQGKGPNGQETWKQHMIMDDYSTKNAGDVTFSQPHGSAVADVDGDGIMDFIVGKRYWSHLDTNTDPNAYGTPVLYVYRTVRNPKAEGGAEFVPELVHNRSGAGAHVWAGDINKDGRTDIVSPTRFGTYVFWGQPRR